MVPQAGRALFDVERVDTKTKVTESSIMDKFASSTGEGENYAASLPTAGDQKTFTQAKVTDSFELTKEAGMYDQYNVVEGLKGAEGIGSAVAKRIELDLQLLLGFGAAASYTDKDGNTVATTAADGLSIWNSSHTVNGSSSTYDNSGTTAFGQTGLEATEDLFRQFLNHDGQQIDRVPDTIFTTRKPNVVNLVREYNKGMNHIEDANRGINVYQGKYDHVVLPYLDAANDGSYNSAKDDYWGLAVRKGPNMKLFVSQDPVVYEPQLVQRNRNLLIQTDAHYAYGFLDAVDAAINIV